MAYCREQRLPVWAKHRERGVVQCCTVELDEWFERPLVYRMNNRRRTSGFQKDRYEAMYCKSG